MELLAEVEGDRPEALPHGGDLVPFMSFALARGFGARHPLIALADRLEALGVGAGPLTLFYGADAEDEEDRKKAELAWQDAAGLQETLDGILELLEKDETVRGLIEQGGIPAFARGCRELRSVTERAAAGARRIRLLYRD